MKKNNIAIGMAIILAITIILSYIFVIHCMHHECTGTECQICLQLEQVKEFVAGLRVLSGLAVIPWTINKLVRTYSGEHGISRVKNTLVLLKVELLD